MTFTRFILFVLILISSYASISAQTWVDTLDQFAREKYLPAKSYSWTWQNAALLKVMVMQYELRPEQEKQEYLDYLKVAMDDKLKKANGNTPNTVASGLGMAFLYKETGNPKYLNAARKIFDDYKKIRRTKDGAVSHLMLFTELWDDTVFMIGQFLMAMYEATGDEMYLEEFLLQFKAHREKLLNEETGLWVHGWDDNDRGHFCFCSQMGWPDKETRASKEFWGRGNGWIVVTLSDFLQKLPKSHSNWQEYAGYLVEMTEKLPQWQDQETGHWYQLPVKNEHPDNYIESSATAMFAYGITTALKYNLLQGEQYQKSIDLAYNGLREHSLKQKGEGYLITTNVCKGTCIGDEKYYFKRKVKDGRAYGLGSFIQFGLLYEIEQGLRKSEPVKKANNKILFEEIMSEMVLVEGGEFMMGDKINVRGESPIHKVELDDFYIGKYELKQSLWERVMGENPSYFKCADCPVEEISMDDIYEFLAKLYQLTGKHFRLTTEAEWEYAARGGKESENYKYAGSDNLDEVAWTVDNANSKTHSVGQKKPNELGIYDMSGNAWEVCEDWFDRSYYEESPTVNPLNFKKKKYRVARGGSWRSGEQRCQAKARNRFIHDHHKQNGSFRLVLSTE